MEGDDDDTFNEGLILPKVLSQLNIILDQYPDDTHILKELIQNAEDAGADTVKLLYDRNHYGTQPKQLFHPEFAQFQGPALYAYNNGVFSEDDWRGLRMVSESVKQKDPFKVGYFGMGFKSVFHITDLPSVISANRLAYIDPHQRLFNATTHAWNLDKHPELLQQYQNQLEPYINVFNCTRETFKQGYYDATLFRFPLRRVPSLLNKRVYEHEKMNYVIESFKNEAHLLPIFLKHLEKIEIYDKAPKEIEPKITFSMSIDNSCISDVRHKRKEFLLKARSADSKHKAITTTFKLLIETKWYSGHNKFSRHYHKYLVNLYYSGSQMSVTFNKLLKDPDVNYLPWVGVAMSLDTPFDSNHHSINNNGSAGNGETKNGNGTTKNGECHEDYLIQDDGRIFCFLPLPVEQGYCTGLPVFINGFFALEQNRKHLKWPGSFNMRKREEMMDKQALWNLCLIKEVLPESYTNLILEAIKLNSSNQASNNESEDESLFNISDQLIYRMFPNSEVVDKKWEEMLYPLYAKLMKHQIVFSKANRGAWIEPKLAVFNKPAFNESVSNLIVDILLEDSVRVVSVPAHVVTAIRKYSRCSLTEVSASLVSKTCRSLQSTKPSIFKRLSRPDKIELLKYFVLQHKFEALDGLELLPLNDHTFHYFYFCPWKADRPIYILNDLEMAKLLPGVDNDLLSLDIEDEIKHILMKASIKGLTQLKVMEVHTLKLLIPKCFPIKWRSKIASSGELISWTPGNIGQPQEEWLELLWNFLTQNSPRDLKSVEKLPILPIKTVVHDNGSKTINLLPLLDLSKVKLLIKDQGLELGDEIRRVVEKIGITVVEDLPEYVRQHFMVTRNYLYLPNYIGVTKALQKLCESHGVSNVMNKLKFDTTSEDKKSLRNLLSKLSPHEMNRNINLLFRDLPLFESVVTLGKRNNRKQIEFISFNECQVAAPFEKIDFPLSSALLDISDVSSQALGKLLGVRQLDATQLLEQVVFRDIESAFYESSQVKEVMVHVLKNFHRLVDSASSTLKKSLQSLPFMENNDLLVPISHFYDPEQDLLKRLFVLEKRFPDSDYLNKGFLPILREIGLKGTCDVEPEDLKEAAEMIAALSGNMANDVNNNEHPSVKTFQGKISVEVLKDKSTALVEFLHKFTHKLNEECCQEDTVLSEALKSINWVIISCDKPAFYPKSLLWYGSRDSSMPSNDESFIKKQFERPQNMISRNHFNLAGSVKPVAYLEFSQDIVKSLGWDSAPSIETIIRHLTNVVNSFSAFEKVVYSEISRGIYTELSKHEPEVVKRMMSEEELPENWIWNGEGFVSCEKVVFVQPFMDLRPFVYSLPMEMTLITKFFENVAGLKKHCDLINVIKSVSRKHETLNKTTVSEDSMHKDSFESQASHFTALEVRKDLHLCVSVLNELKSHLQCLKGDEQRAEFLKQLHDNLYLPIHTEDNTGLTMALMADCTFCDEEWLRQGYSMEDFGLEDSEDGSKISLVHPNVPISTSEALGVPTLMSRMLDAEELDISFGQSDSLTHRLNSLLLEYSDGFAIPKELVQNADDAGATEVSFLYDERENDDAKTCLLDEGMKECQGAALWVYNDAVFTDSDFDNITKVNGATKLSQPEKIGKFGLGFNSVYNITDVPSFVSRHSIVIFDPHTYHLGKSIRDKRKPGIKIDLKRHKKNLKRFGNQFKPYNGIFNCNLSATSQVELYNGTLFRFPLRSRQQAAKSEISSKHYDDREIRELLKILVNSASNLLLFSQNVLKIKIFHLPKKGNPLTDVVELYSFEKNLVTIIREIPPCLSEEIHLEKEISSNALELLKQCCSLKAGVEITKRHRDLVALESIPTLNSSLVISMETNCSNSSKSEMFFEDKNLKARCTNQKWLICNFLGVHESLKMAVTEETLTSNVSVAVPIEGDEDIGYKPIPIVNESEKDLKEGHSGLIFTFMPLPLRSGLPVHINGAFAVTSNRKMLCQKSEDDKFDMRPVWNRVLMEDALSEAYLMILNDLSNLAKHGNAYDFSILWPNVDFSSPSCEHLVKQFYKTMTTTDQYKILSDDYTWKSFKDSLFVDFELSKTELGKVAYNIFCDLKKKVFNEDKIVVYFEDWLEKTLIYAEIKLEEFSNNYNIVRFLKELFFPNIIHIDSQQRDILVLYALSLQNKEVDDLISTSNCIPVTPNGEKLKSVKDLIDPSSILAKMYSEEDEKFPLSKSSYSQPECLLWLRSIGMKHHIDQISWEDMLERVETVSNITSDEEVLKDLVKAILQILDMLLELNESSTVFKKSTFKDIRERFVSLPFLTLLKKPTNYRLKWKNDELSSVELIRPVDAYPPETANLVSCVKALIDKSLFPAGQRVFDFLLLTPEHCEPTAEDVLDQLDAIIEDPDIHSIIHSKFKDNLKTICYEIYEFLQKQHKFNTSDKKQIIIDALKSKAFILTPAGFLKANKLAFNFQHSICAPYLFTLPDSLKINFHDLFKAVGMRDHFEATDYVKALQEMKYEFGNDSLDRSQLRKAIELVNCLNDCMTEQSSSIQNIVCACGPIFIPDANEKLKSASDLCYNEPECQWFPKNESISFSHPLIPFTISKQLGVNTNRQETLKKHSTGISFGQQEKLTNRIRNILSGYPCDKEILKELLQNADDSGASEISFIKDNRHHSVERIFDKSWQPLQGPALCVYNDKAFTEEDLEEIQKLGEGSKRNDPNKTGQYGVGFNCVYHLTDVPSFLTRGPSTPETLCIFDPHARYVPDSTLQMPGRRYQDVGDLKELFPDVFSCYLEDKFNMQNGTMFRLPLRNEEMSRSSDLSDKIITSDLIDNLFKRFSTEMVDCMLFLKNITKISLFEIDRITGKMNTLSIVESSMDELDYHRKKQFLAVLKLSSLSIKTGDILNVAHVSNSHILKISNQKGDWEKWMVTQSLGCHKDVRIKEEIVEAFKKRELRLMPQGGVAVLLDANNFKIAKQRSKKLFCFLPLPLTSPFHVHVNGHFALDYETRRNLLYDEQESNVKTEWNKFLFGSVIASAYVEMLEILTDMVCEYGQLYDDNVTLIDSNYFNSLFPIFKDDTPAYCRTCAINLYNKIFKYKSKVIAVSRIHLNVYNTKEGFLMEEEKYSIEWHSINDEEDIKPVFDDLDNTFSNDRSPTKYQSKTDRSSLKNENLRKILLKLNFPLIKANMQIYGCFMKSGVNVEVATPMAVIRYLQMCAPSFERCKLGNLPKALSNTPFDDKQELKTLLQYCLTDSTYFGANIDDLPLQLTADSFLKPFSLKHPVFISKYPNLFPQLGYRFIDLAILDEMLSINTEVRNNIFLKLSIKEFSEILPTVLPKNKFINQDFIVNDNFNFSTSLTCEWFSSVWKYIKHECEDLEDKEEIKNHLKPIEEWCLLPVCIKKLGNSDVSSLTFSKYLFPLKNIHFVLDFTKTSLISSPLKNCLRKLNVPELDRDFFSKELGTVVEQLLSNLDEPSSVAEALLFALENFKSLITMNECMLLIKYFSDSMIIWKDNDRTVSLIRSLPIFITTEDNATALLNFEVYVLFSEVPHMSLDTWNNKRLIFLKSNLMYMEMYNTLNCQIITPSKLYLNFILPNFHSINTDNWLKQLHFIKDKILNDENNEDRAQIIDLLKNLNFIIVEDALGSNYYPASHFFDPRSQLFKIMFSNHDQSVFPPPPFAEYKWLEFMKLVGLQSSLTKELFIRFALEIEQEAYTDFNDKTIEKCKTVISKLFNSHFLSDEAFLDNISSIRFIPSAKIKSVHKLIYPAYDEKQSSMENLTTFVAFEEGIIEPHEALVWSVSYILPEFANPFKMVGRNMNFETELYNEVDNLKTSVGKCLKVNRKPCLSLVIKHLNNICSGTLENSNSTEFIRIDILKQIYAYLQVIISKKGFSEDVESQNQIYQLSNSPCILSNMGQTFVCPSQIVIDLYQGDQIINYLHKIPLELGEFKNLFLELGATSNATEKQYSVVLEKIYLTAPSTRLHPNELKKVFKAVHGLFSILYSNKNHQSPIQEVPKLYLPTTNGFLIDSSKIVYNDEPSWRERIEHLDEQFLVNLHECKLDIEHHLEMITLLPTHLRPKMLSNVVSEKLEKDSHDTRCMHDVANKLKCQLNTRAFALGLARLIKHEHRKIGHRIKQEVFEVIQHQLKGINVYGVDKVNNYLVYSELRLLKSEVENQCFIDKVIDAESGEIFWEIYIDKSLKLDDELQVRVSEIVNKITGSLLKQNIHYIQPILSCPPHSISKVLDRLKIRPDRSNKNDVLTSTLPPAGSFIPIEDHHLLKEDFGSFESGEYVGYEINDELTGEPTFIHAIIHSCIGDEHSPKKPKLSRTRSNSVKYNQEMRKENTKKMLMQRYKINIGEEREFIEVSAADLYKFHRVDRYVGRDSNNSDSLSNSKSPLRTNKSPIFGLDTKSSFYEPINYNNSKMSNALVPVNSKYKNEPMKAQKHKQKTDHSDYDSVFLRQDSRTSENSNSQDSDKASSGEQDDVSLKKQRTEELQTNLEDQEDVLSVEEIRNEITNTLEEAWNLPVDQRRKIIKRLYLKWHPDKNPDNEKVATTLTQHIQAELERLELGLGRHKDYNDFQQTFHADPRNPFAKSASFQENFYRSYQKFFDEMNRRAKEHKEQKERYKENFSREYRSSNQSNKFNFDVPPTFASTNPQPAQARKFLRQAEEDLKAADNDFSSPTNPAYEWVCIKSHQAAEKALKAAQYFVDASTSFSHDLVALVSSLEDIDLRKLALELQGVVGNSNKLYNPAPIDFVVIPHEEYTIDMADRAIRLSGAILEKVTFLIDGKD